MACQAKFLKDPNPLNINNLPCVQHVVKIYFNLSTTFDG